MTTVPQFLAAAGREPPLRAPYNFVPLNEKVLPSPWYDDGWKGPDRSTPHPQGLCGELVVDWQVETPLLVGGRDNNRPFQLGQGGPFAIPGASLRGMIRSVLEILSYARLDLYDDDQRFALRDFDAVTWQALQTKSGAPAGTPKTITLPNGNPKTIQVARAGWLRRVKAGDNYSYELTECDYVDVPIADLCAALRISEGEWHCKSLHDRHGLLDAAGLAGQIDLGLLSAPLAGQRGTPVVAGLIKTEVERKANPRIQRTNKIKEVAFLAGTGTTWPISAQAFAAFAKVQVEDGARHTGNPEENWSFWKPKLLDERSPQPIPVFFRGDPNAARAGVPAPRQFHMALTRLMRVPFALTPKDVAGRSQNPDQIGGKLDFVQALFGHVPPEGLPAGQTASTAEPRRLAWRGRVRFEIATLIGEVRPLEALPAVTMKPRASFYPYYLRPKRLPVGATETVNHPVDWSSLDARLAGRKRYPPRDGAREVLPRAPNQNPEQENRLTFLPAAPAQPLRFRSRIRFHNLLPAELGGLAWAIGLGRPGGGENRRLRHMLGRAKGFGYGQLKAVIDDPAQTGWIEANAGGDPPSLADCAARFEQWVTAALGSTQPFAELPEVAALLALCDAALGARLRDALRFPLKPEAGAPDDEAQRILDAYADLRKRTACQNPRRPEWLGGQSISRDPAADAFQFLPDYPRR